jgi:hypothetical protein
MAITQLENFAGVQTGIELSAIATAAGAGALGLPGAIPLVNAGANWGSGGQPWGLGVEKVGNKYWLGGYTGYGIVNVFNQYVMNIGSLVPASANVFTIGLRLKRKLGTPTNPLNFPVFKTLRGAYWMQNIPANVTEWYLELVFNRTDRTISAYIDGRFQWINSVTDTTDKAEFGANTWALGFPISGVEGIWMTDIYVTADIGDDTPSGRLGPQDITDIPMQVVSSTDWDMTNLANVQAWRDFATDTGKYILGNGVNPVLKLKPVDGYVLPNVANVNGVMVQSRCAYAQGSPSDVVAKITRGTHNDSVTLSPNSAVTLTGPAVRLINGSRNSAESVPATALNGLEVSLTVVAR